MWRFSGHHANAWLTVSTAGLFLLTILLAACAAKHVREASPSLPRDGKLMIQMIDLNDHADKMLIPCVSQSGHEELSNLCQGMLNEHRRDNERLSTWLRDKYNTKRPEPDPHPLWLGTLKGEQFDREFLKQIIDNHTELAEWAERCSSSTTNAELKQMCSAILSRSVEEMKSLRTYSCSWYRACN